MQLTCRLRTQVDYATGDVRLQSGETLTKEQVDEVVRPCGTGSVGVSLLSLCMG